MGGLQLIWVTALSLVAGALGWMSLLILARLIHTRQTARRASDRKLVEQGLMDLVRGANATKPLAPYVGRADLMAEVVLEFLAVVRGADRDQVLAALRRMGVDATLRDQLGHGSMASQLACIDALAVFPSVFTERSLRQTAAAAPPRLRLAALRSLWLSGIAVELDSVLADWKAGALRHSGLLEEFVRELVCAAPEAGLQAIRRTDLSGPMLMTLIDGVGEAGDYAALDKLMELAAGSDVSVRTAALHALGRLRHPAGGRAVAAALRDPDWRVRQAACKAAGDIGLADLSEALAARLADVVWTVRFQAAAALAGGGPAGLQVLRDVAAAGSGPASAAAALALAESGA